MPNAGALAIVLSKVDHQQWTARLLPLRMEQHRTGQQRQSLEQSLQPQMEVSNAFRILAVLVAGESEILAEGVAATAGALEPQVLYKLT